MAERKASKVCRGCQIDKRALDFSPDKRATDGLYSRCKECRKVYRGTLKKKIQNQSYRARNREKLADKDRNYRLRNRDRLKEVSAAYALANKPRLVAYKARWAKLNRETILERQRAWRYANPEKAALSVRRWALANPEKVRAIVRNRRARKRGAEGSHTAGDILHIFAVQEGACKYCRVTLPSSYHVDHIKALVKGGSNWPSNLQLLCQSCNSRKSYLDEDVFLQRRAA